MSAPMEAGHNVGAKCLPPWRQVITWGINGKGDNLLPYFIADFLLALCASSLKIPYPSLTPSSLVSCVF